MTDCRVTLLRSVWWDIYSTVTLTGSGLTTVYKHLSDFNREEKSWLHHQPRGLDHGLLWTLADSFVSFSNGGLSKHTLRWKFKIAKQYLGAKWSPTTENGVKSLPRFSLNCQKSFHSLHDPGERQWSITHLQVLCLWWTSSRKINMLGKGQPMCLTFKPSTVWLWADDVT